MFRGLLKVTVICRHPSDPNGTFFMTEDQIAGVKALIDQEHAKATGAA